MYRVDDTPVPLLYGRLPLYRTLAEGTEGADVLQLERNLSALGYTGFTVDKTFGSATTAAVKRWQEDLGVTETGTVRPGEAVVAPGRIRVAARKAAVGDKVGGPVLTYTGTTRVVTVDLDVEYQRLARKGAAVEVELPSGDTVKGRISSVGKVAEAGGDDRPATVEVEIAVAGSKELGSYDKAPVVVHLTASGTPTSSPCRSARCSPRATAATPSRSWRAGGSARCRWRPACSPRAWSRSRARACPRA